MIQATSAEPPQAGIRELLAPLWARKFLIAITVVLTTSCAYAYYDAQPRKYRAATQLFLNPSQVEALITGVPSSLDADRTALNLAALAKTRPVAQLAAQKLKDNRSAARLLRDVSVTAQSGTDFMTVSSVHNDPLRAAQTANAYAIAFVESRTEGFRQQVDKAATQARRQLEALGRTSTPQRDALRDRLSRLEGFLAFPTGDIRQLDKAVAPRTAFSPKPVRNAIFAAAISLVLAMFAAYALSRFDLRVRHLSDVQDAYGLPLLGAIPRHQVSKAADPTAVHPATQEPLRSLQTSLRLASLEGPVRTILVTSAVPGEGKSTLVRNLALVQRDEGARVVVVDADLRRPVMRSWFKLPRAEGLTDVLARQTSLSDAMQRVASEPTSPAPEHRGTVETLKRIGELFILSSGPTPANPSAVLAAEPTAALITGLRGSFDYVLIDAPPLLPVSDALPLLKLVDGVILVSRVGTTHRAAAKRLMELLGRVPDANIIGVVANDVEGDELYGAYSYSYTAPNGGRSKA